MAKKSSCLQTPWLQNCRCYQRRGRPGAEEEGEEEEEGGALNDILTRSSLLLTRKTSKRRSSTGDGLLLISSQCSKSVRSRLSPSPFSIAWDGFKRTPTVPSALCVCVRGVQPPSCESMSGLKEMNC